MVNLDRVESIEHQRLIEKLRRIEALFADRAATDGEKVAAGEAADRIRERLEMSAKADPPEEFTFALHNPWSYRLFIALARRYVLNPTVTPASGAPRSMSALQPGS